MRLRILAVEVFNTYAKMMVECAGSVMEFTAPSYEQVLKKVRAHYNLG